MVLPHTMQQANSFWHEVTFANCIVKEIDVGYMMFIFDDLITFLSLLIHFPLYSIQHSNTL